jgi:hypothetical protein
MNIVKDLRAGSAALRGSGVPATRGGRCECCHTAYSAGALVIWDSVGLVLAQHRSVSSRR